MTSINLSKGSSINLSKAMPGHKNYYIGLGWKEKPGQDLDVSAFPCVTDASGNPVLPSPEPHYIICYATTFDSICGGIKHSGDNRNGKDRPDQGTDDEVIRIYTDVLDPRYTEISIVATIHNENAPKIDFSQVEDAYLHICEMDATGAIGREVARYSLTENCRGFTAFQFGSLMKENGDWVFYTVGQGYDADLGAVIGMYAPSVTTTYG